MGKKFKNVTSGVWQPLPIGMTTIAEVNNLNRKENECRQKEAKKAEAVKRRGKKGSGALRPCTEMWSGYKEYLRTDWWRRRRNVAISLAKRRCNRCKLKKRRLQVHHTSYKHLGYEPDEDLEVLCGDCHAGIHDSVIAQNAHLDAIIGRG